MSRTQTQPNTSVKPFSYPKTYAKKKANVIQRIGKGISKRVNKMRQNSLARQTRNLKRQEKVLAQKLANQNLKNQNQAAINEARYANLQTKTKLNKARLDANAQRGGPIGFFARKRQTAIAKGEADVAMAKMEPKLSAKEREIRIQTEADVKKTRAKGAAVATAVSALGGGIASKAESDSKAKVKQAEADIEASKALTSTLNSVPSVTEDQYSKGSAAGLLTGVR